MLEIESVNVLRTRKIPLYELGMFEKVREEKIRLVLDLTRRKS